MSLDRVNASAPTLTNGLGLACPQVGTVLTLPGAVAAELLAEPFDFVWIDLEHGALGPAEAQEMILGAQAAGARAFVRLGLSRAEALVGPMLDAGADGIVVADVRERSRAEWAASLLHHPPVGRRGYGPRRAGLRGRITVGGSRPDPELWVQIESQQGVAAAQDIARTGMVDALIVGLADLCVDLGVPVGIDDPRLHDAIRAVIDATVVHGGLFGLAGPLQPVEPLGDLAAAASVLIHSTDARLCAAAVDQVAEALRGAPVRRLPTRGATRGG